MKTLVVVATVQLPDKVAQKIQSHGLAFAGFAGNYAIAEVMGRPLCFQGAAFAESNSFAKAALMVVSPKPEEKKCL